MRREELALSDPPSNDRPSDRWMCGRSGKPCSRGPISRAMGMSSKCPLAEPCHPIITWNGRRKQIIVLAITAVILLLGGIISQHQWKAAVFKPGKLASPHAQILAGTLTSDRCASCHPQAATSQDQDRWFSGDIAAHDGVTQADRCLDCHHQTMVRSKALLAHNLTQSARMEIKLASQKGSDDSWHDLLPSPAIDQENVQCSVCHQEHRGADADLLAISDAQCQTCHSDRFGDFATSHPDWQRWPYGRGPQIAFNHSTHANKHFPATVQGSKVAQFRCADCHQRRENNELTRSTTFERACKSCHNAPLQLETAEGFELLALPTLPESSAEKLGLWPESVTGFYDGKVAPITALLLRGDNDFADAYRFIPEGDISRIDDTKPEVVKAVETIARAHRGLMHDVGIQGQHIILKRAESLGISRNTMLGFVRSLSPQLVSDTNRQWFSKSPEDLAKTATGRSMLLLSDSDEINRRISQQGLFFLAAHPLWIDYGNLRLPPVDQPRPASRATTHGPSRTEEKLELSTQKKAEFKRLGKFPEGNFGSQGNQLRPEAKSEGDDLLGADDLLSNHDPLLEDSNELIDEEDALLANDPLRDDEDALLDDGLLGDGGHLVDDTLLDGGDLLDSDPLSADPLHSSIGDNQKPKRFEASEMLPAGGWYRDDLRMAIRYRGGGHADQVLRSAIDMISQLPVSDSTRKNLLKNRAIASCVACHPGAITTTGGWQSKPLIGRRREFTKFTHGPHLNVAQLADCSHCHRVSPDSKNETSINLASGSLVDPHDFLPMTRQDCAACHTAKSAGDSCVTCHRYHIDLR